MNEKVDALVDSILTTFKQAGADEVAYDVVDTVFRPYLQWMHRARSNRENPGKVRSTILHLTSSMIVEAALKMGEVAPDGTRIPMEIWLGEFMLDLKDELIADMEHLDPKKSSH